MKQQQALFLILLPAIVFASCINQSVRDIAPGTSDRDTTMLTIIVGDSVHYYTGTLTDSLQIKCIPLNEQLLLDVVKEARESANGTLFIMGKPSYEPACMPRLIMGLQWLDATGIVYGKTPQLDEMEEKWLHFETPPYIVNGKFQPSTLLVPRDESKQEDKKSAPINVLPGQPVLLPVDEKDIYVYTGIHLATGKVIRLKELGDWLQKYKTAKTNHPVLIRYDDNASYKSVVNILDELIKVDINNYQTLDIEPDELKIIDNIRNQKH